MPTYEMYKKVALQKCAELGITYLRIDNRLHWERIREEMYVYVQSFYDPCDINSAKEATKLNQKYFEKFLQDNKL